MAGVISQVNSTTALLGAGATFDGFFDGGMVNFASVTVLVQSDVAGAANGLSFIWSDNGIDDRYIQSFNQAAGAAVFTTAVFGNFFRLRYVNGASIQTAFTIHTLYHDMPFQLPLVRLGASQSFESQAIPTSTRVHVITGTSEAGATTATPLAGAASFTMAYVSALPYSSTIITAFSDQSGTLNVDYSGDGTNTDHTESYPLTGGSNLALTLPPRGQFWRVRYVNGATPQTVFRMNAFYRPPGADSGALGTQYDAESTSGDGRVIPLLKNLRTRLTTLATLMAAGEGSTPKTPTSRSGTITSGGVAQTLAGANAVRTGAEIINTSAESLWVNPLGGTAAANGADCFELVPHQGWSTGPVAVNTAISIVGATTGSRWFAWESS